MRTLYQTRSAPDKHGRVRGEIRTKSKDDGAYHFYFLADVEATLDSLEASVLNPPMFPKRQARQFLERELYQEEQR